MSQNHNIQTENNLLADEETVNIGGVVPTGMTRYVTFVQVNQSLLSTGGSAIYLCSGTASVGTTDTLASAAQKLVVTVMSAVQDMSVPPAPDTEHPLFSVAAGKYLNAHMTSVAAVDNDAYLFVQFFDE